MHRTKENSVIVVAGCGQFGSCIASQLDQAGEAVVIVDLDQEAFTQLDQGYNGVTIVGDASDIEVLRQCGINRSKAVIAVTHYDNVNLMIAQIASEIYAVPLVMAKVSDPALVRVETAMNVIIHCPALGMARVVMNHLAAKEG
jgi:trk system potassium uptake protein TrkA